MFFFADQTDYTRVGQTGWSGFKINTALQNCLTAAYCVIFLLSLFGNVMVVFIVRTKPYMKTVTNLLIANMSVADLLMTCFAMPYSVLYLYVQSRWFGGTLGSLTCKTVQFFVAMSIAASILTLAVVSLDRFFAIIYPLKRSTLIPRMLVTNALIWSLACLFVASHFYSYRVTRFADGYYHCYVDWRPLANMKSLKVYYTLLFVFLYLIPLMFIAFFYTIICRKLWLRKIPGNPSINNRRNANIYKRRTVKMLIIIVVIFALCWAPVHVMHYLTHYQYATYKKLPPSVVLTAFFVSHANSSINPLLYIILNRNFRLAFVDIMKAWSKFYGPALSRVRTFASSQKIILQGQDTMESVQCPNLERSRRAVYDVTPVSPVTMRTIREPFCGPISRVTLVRLTAIQEESMV